MAGLALVVGASGIVGNNLARHLRARGWQVYGLARRPPNDIDGMLPVQADLLEAASLRTALQGLRPTHAFISAWLRQETEADNIRINGAMVRNVLDALSPVGSLGHVALVTGLKHYLGPFEAYGKGKLPATPFREDQPRLDVDNFYYAQEDELFAAAGRAGFGWSVHRPHTIIGYAVGNAMNMGVTLAAYATICKATGRPFLFPGSAMQWNGLTDMTDAMLLARHLEWAATTEAARDQHSTSSTARSSAGAGCGDAWRAGSGWSRHLSRGRASRSSASLPTRDRSGPTSPANTPWRSPISPSSHRPGTPTPTWAGRSRSSPT